MSTTYLNKNYQIVVNCFQTSIMCMFNENAVLTVKQIQEKCNLSPEDLKSSLMKLCNPKTTILLKQQEKKPTFDPNEEISVNPNFSNNNIRLNLIPMASV